MAKVTIRPVSGRRLSQIAISFKLADALEQIAQPIFDEAAKDPNKEYVRTLRMRRFYSGGRRGRVSIQIGPAPLIGRRVEAKRGTMARALAKAGF